MEHGAWNTEHAAWMRGNNRNKTKNILQKESLLFSLLNIKHYIFITSSGCSLVELLSWSLVVLIQFSHRTSDPKFIVIDCNHQIPIISIDCDPSIDEQWWRRRDMRSIYFHVPSIKCIKIQFILLNFKLFSIKLPILFFVSLLFTVYLYQCLSSLSALLCSFQRLRCPSCGASEKKNFIKCDERK